MYYLYQKKTYYLYCLFFCGFMVFQNHTIKSSVTVPAGFTRMDYINFFAIILFRNTATFLLLIIALLIKSKTIPYIYLVVNSFVLALLIAKLPSIMYLVLVVPHGIIEVYAFLNTVGLTEFGINTNQSFTELSKLYRKNYIFIVVAAFVEGVITPLLALNIISN